MIRNTLFVFVATLTLGTACKKAAPPRDEPEAKPALKTDRVPRGQFNRLAAELGHPVYWASDEDGDRTLEPNEISVVWGLVASPPSYVEGGEFTDAFATAYEAIVNAHNNPAPPPDPRKALLRREARQGQLTLLQSDFGEAPAEERAIVEHILRAADHIETLYRLQKGSEGLQKQLESGDSLGQLAFYLNHGPWCTGPETEGESACSATPVKPPRLVGLYPATLQVKEGFCEQLGKHENADALLNPFTVVRTDQEGNLIAVPYTEAWPKPMKAAADELTAAAAAITSEREAGFKAYLQAAAKAFTDNDWFAADEAWAKMGETPSAWYLRIGPDETYFEPCNRKAGFHISFARINPAAKTWRERLEPIKQQLEQTIAEMAGKPYEARTVAFQVPDFIDIVLNAGDSRSPRGATAGQSLPNWGPVANESRGRQVVMTNLSNDPDVAAIRRDRAGAMLCTDTFERVSDDTEPRLAKTVLHEAAHNLGPAKEYRARGKTDAEAFGGPLASIMEELKAETAANYLVDWLAQRGSVKPEFAASARLSGIVWALKHISKGYYDAAGDPKTYSQIAGIQVAFLLEKGAVTWKADEKPARGQDGDMGCLSIDDAKVRTATEELMKVVGGIKARGDAAGARRLVEKYIDGEGAWTAVAEAARERGTRFPQPTYLYSIRM